MNPKHFLLLLFLLCVAVTSLAPTPKRGKERLLELVVTPKVDLGFRFSYGAQSFSELTNEESLPNQITNLQWELKQSAKHARMLVELGCLFEKNGDTNAARASFQDAAAIAEKNTQVRPQDGLAFVDWGNASWALGKVEIAGNAYRRATQVSSNDWECWAALGHYLASQTKSLLWPTNFANLANSRFRPSPNDLERALKLRAEATDCFDRAVALAPNEVEVHLQRAWYKCDEERFSGLENVYRGEEEPELGVFATTLYSTSAIPDLRKAATLQPQAYKLLGLTAWFEWASVAMSPNAIATDRPTEFSDFPESTRRSITDAMKRLRELANSNDAKLAAGALETLASLRMMTQLPSRSFDGRSVAEDMQRAVSLDPSRETAWDLLLGGMLNTASPGEFAQVCENRVKHKKSARNYLLLAKAQYRCGSYNKALEATQAGLELETKDVALNLMLAAALMRQDKEWARVHSVLKRVEELSAEIEDSEEMAQRRNELMLNVAIGYAINGRPEKARELLDGMLKTFPEEERAKEILDAIP